MLVTSRVVHAGSWAGSIALALLLAIGIAGSTHADPDMWHEMALAREILAQRGVPSEDQFAYTPTVSPCVHHEWGTGMALYAAAAAAGEDGILLVGWALAAGIAGLAAVTARRSGASPQVILAIAPVAIFLSWIGFTFVRAQMFSLFFVALLLECIRADRSGRRGWCRSWPFAHLLWLNLHAGFVVGVGLLGVHAVETALRRRPVRHLFALIAIELALIVVSPWGWHYYGYLARALTMPRPSISEWGPVTSAFLPIPILWGFSLVLVLYALARRGWRGVPGIGIVLVAAVAAGLHQRHLSIHALTWFAHVPGWVEETPLGRMIRDGWRRWPRATLAAWAPVLLGSLVALARTWKWQVEIPANRGDHSVLVYPAGAVDHMDRSGFRGNVFVPFTVGAYVTYRLHPRVEVNIDGRYEVAYPPGSLERTQRLMRAEGDWEGELMSLGTDAVLVPATAELARGLDARTSWQLAYADDAYLFFVRTAVPVPIEDRRGERIVARFAQ